MAENLVRYGASLAFDGRQALRQLRKYKETFNKVQHTILKNTQKLNNEMVQGEQRVQKVKENTIEKEKRRQESFNQWRKKQMRSANFAELKAHQQVELMKIFASNKSAQEIKSTYTDTLLAFKLAKKREVAAEKQANRLRLESAKRTESRIKAIKARANNLLGRAGGVAGSAVSGLLGLGAAALGTVAVGAKDASDTRAEAVNAGMKVEDYQRFLFGARNATNLSRDEIMSSLQDVNDRRGEIMNLEIKDGEIKGVGELTDLLNFLVKNGQLALDEKTIKDFVLNSGNSAEFLEKVFKLLQTSGADTNTQTFLMESLASNSFRLMAQIDENSTMYQRSLEEMKNLRLGIDAANQTQVRDVGQTMSAMWNKLTYLPLEAFEAFAMAIKPETAASMNSIVNSIIKLARAMGDDLANVLERIVPWLEKLLASANENSLIDNFRSVGNILFDEIVKPALVKVGEVLLGVVATAIPEGMRTDQLQAMYEKYMLTDEERQALQLKKQKEMDLNWQRIQPKQGGFNYLTPPPQAKTDTSSYVYPSAQPAVVVENNSTVKLEVDGKVLAQTVTKDQQFNEAMRKAAWSVGR
ncbi:TPA: hypothetical protein ACGF8S_002975 [Vibrio cholerae]|uniref:Uncharacterized protein n=2 Tax=Vibrio cholerae TaxID=666 RepID=M1TB63_VIBCE|nr:hypothetical protein [Vibrio cholerae]AGG36655.1 hypothetical protein [Vibrio cholerae O1 biovar El Tor]CSA97539.1 Uncharacterised protein [Vibrio cholerae]CSD81888.1 Uncharacterised protein [Vibrio cholerae]